MRAAALVLAVALTASVAAQTPAEPVFEAASIKPVTARAPGVGPRGTDLFSRSYITLQLLLVYAYELPAYRIVGGPAWVTTDHFDVLAKANQAPTAAQMRTLVQQLLTERFGLRLRRETREVPTYDLVFARSDHRLGPNMKPAEVDCTPFVTGQRPMSEAPVIDGPGGRVPRCALGFSSNPATGVMTSRLNGYTLPRLADFLERDVNRPVRDRTGLTGAFDFELTYVGKLAGDIPGLPRPTGEGPALLTAIQEQAGLKLEAAKGPVELLVIDAAQQPTAN